MIAQIGNQSKVNAVHSDPHQLKAAQIYFESLDNLHAALRQETEFDGQYHMLDGDIYQ